jgi:nicotinamide phosphoribosyltransferase
VAFGQGGALLQMVNRDDQKFAMKCSAAFVNGEWVDVFKDPITDKGKRSKKGKLKLVKDIDQYITVDSHDKMFHILYDELEVVFENGVLIRDMTFDEVRANAAI